MNREENPFNDLQVAKEWINSVENERGRTRDTAIYPALKKWASGFGDASVVLEIGAGQGICSEKLESSAQYIGIEPSVVLVERAKEKYAATNRQFIVGDAYDLPVPDKSVDGVFSVNVWFHLANLERASEEMKRTLKPEAVFLIITANPNAYDIWESFYVSPEREGNRIAGKVNIPINPLSRNTFYEHSLQEILNALRAAGLVVHSTEEIGEVEHGTDKKLFVAIGGSCPQ